MGADLRFDYFYGMECEQFAFYRIPKMVIRGEQFKHLSCEAKLLYGLMLDRVSLSLKNGWLDEEDRAYIYYTVADIMDDLGISNGTCSKVLKELDAKSGIGLIEKKRQGLGKPDIIYVKNFSVYESEEHLKNAGNTVLSPEVQKTNFKKSENRTSESLEIELQEVRKLNFKKSENQTSRSSEIETQEVRKTYSNNNNVNDNESSDTKSIYHSVVSAPGDDLEMEDGMKEISEYIEQIKVNVEYDLVMEYGDARMKGLYDELFQLVCEVVCVKQDYVKIGGKDYPYNLVKERFLKLDGRHFEYVIERMKQTTVKINNIKAYLITALFNAGSTIDHYYQQEVQYDMYGGGWQ